MLLATGNWKMKKKAKRIDYETAFWNDLLKIDKKLISQAEEKINRYFGVVK